MKCEEKVEKLLNIIERVASGEYERDNWRGILDSVAELFEADIAAIGETKEGYVLYKKFSSYADRFENYDPEEFKVPIWRSALGDAIKKGYIMVNDYQNYERAVEGWRKMGRPLCRSNMIYSRPIPIRLTRARRLGMRCRRPRRWRWWCTMCRVSGYGNW